MFMIIMVSREVFCTSLACAMRVNSRERLLKRVWWTTTEITVVSTSKWDWNHARYNPSGLDDVSGFGINAAVMYVLSTCGVYNGFSNSFFNLSNNTNFEASRLLNLIIVSRIAVLISMCVNIIYIYTHFAYPF